MTGKLRNPTSILVRGATVAGRLTEAWRQRQRARVQDAYVRQWKEAWVRGCETAWAGQAASVPPGLTESQRAAWTAGWRWAQTQPDRRHASSDVWIRNGRRRADGPGLMRAAKGGAVALVVYETARWLMSRSRAQRPAPAEPPATDPPPAG